MVGFCFDIKLNNLISNQAYIECEIVSKSGIVVDGTHCIIEIVYVKLVLAILQHELS